MGSPQDLKDTKSRSINILLDNGGYEFSNLGDTTMLQVAISRILDHLPDAQIHVFTLAPQILQEYCPESIPILPTGRYQWLKARILPIPNRFLLKSWRKKVKGWEYVIKLRYPRLAELLRRMFQSLTRNPDHEAEDFFLCLAKSEMVVASGGGYLTDYFKMHAASVLDTLALAQRLGKRTALFGQGIGPITDEELLKKARFVFPKLEILGLREGLASLDYANSLGANAEHTIVTGDDAIETALSITSDIRNKNCIGVNFRQGRYAGTFTHIFPDIGMLLQEIALDEETQLIPIPIYLSELKSDLASVNQLLTLDEQEVEYANTIKTPEVLIQQIDRCKLVITGSYHAAVFALSRGIPVVALVGSDYYESKFRGLANQFSLGCKIVSLTQEGLLPILRIAITEAIQQQEIIKDRLIFEAQKQSALSKSTWAQFLKLREM